MPLPRTLPLQAGRGLLFAWAGERSRLAGRCCANKWTSTYARTLCDSSFGSALFCCGATESCVTKKDSCSPRT